MDFTGPGYGVMKTALVRYAQDLAFKLAPKMIRANTVSPGNTYFDGGIWQWIEANNPTLYAKSLALNPTGRMAKPEEIARGVVFLASPASSFTTGTNLVIDGALTRGVQLYRVNPHIVVLISRATRAHTRQPREARRHPLRASAR